jgi:hypothetical protein
VAKFFIPDSDLQDAQRAIVSKFHTSPILDITDILRLGLGYYEEEDLHQQDAGDRHNYAPYLVSRYVRTILWHLVPFLREQASYAGLYISEYTDWSQWFSDRDHCRMGVWLYMPEIPETRLEAIEIFESFGEFPT